MKAKKAKKTKKKSSGKSKTDNVFSLAKKIRKPGENWKATVKRAAKQI